MVLEGSIRTEKMEMKKCVGPSSLILLTLMVCMNHSMNSKMKLSSMRPMFATMFSRKLFSPMVLFSVISF